MRKCKSKYKKTGIGIIIFLSVLILISLFLIIMIDFKLIGNKTMILNYGDKYSEPGYRLKIFKKNLTDKVKTTNNIKKELGKYKVKYSYKILGPIKIVKTRTIIVDDVVGPNIELANDGVFEVTINTEYEEPGYKAMDNLDGDVTNKVKIENNVDSKKLGDYKIIYSVVDSHGNKTKKERKVRVQNKKPTQMSISEYTLDGWYDEVKLKETADQGEEYFNKITMIGDSNTMNMYLNGYLTGKRAWALPCLTTTSMLSKEINLYGLNKKMKLLDAIKEYKPETIILNLGTFSTSWITEEEFLESSNKVIKSIQELSPNTKIILISLYPIRKGNNINNFKQEDINKYNFYILELAKKYNLKFLDIQEELKGPDGYAADKYFIDDKFHFTMLGHQTVKKYIKTHALT